MTILVLGGTGAMGAALVRILGDQGHDVVVTSRSRQGQAGPVRYVMGDAKSDAFLQPLLNQQRWSAIVDFMVYSTDMFRSRVGMLLAATDQYVYLSSARVYAAAAGALTEESPRLLDICTDQDYLATDEYALSKARQEDVVMAAGTNWTIVRPYITYGPGRLQLAAYEKENWLFRAMHGRSIMLCDAVGQRLTTMSSGDAVAQAMAALLGKPAALGEVFHITGTYACTWFEIAETYAAVVGQRLGRAPAVARADFQSFLQLQRNKYQITQDRMFDRVFDVSKISRFHAMAQPADPLESLRKCLNRFLDAPRFDRITGWDEARMDNLSGEHTPIWQIPGFKQKLQYIKTRYA